MSYLNISGTEPIARGLQAVAEAITKLAESQTHPVIVKDVPETPSYFRGVNEIRQATLNRAAQYLYEEIGDTRGISLSMLASSKPDLVAALDRALERAGI